MSLPKLLALSDKAVDLVILGATLEEAAAECGVPVELIAARKLAREEDIKALQARIDALEPIVLPEFRELLDRLK
jgi:hypothetical protein